MATSTIKDRNIYVRELGVPYTASANGGRANGNLYTLINNDMPSGCQCLGIVGFGSGSGSVLVISAQYYNNAYSYDLRNVGSSSVTTSAIFRYLYQRV